MVQTENEGKILIIEKYDYGFRFYFSDPDDRISYFIKQDPDNPEIYEIIEEEDRMARKMWHDSYENNGVRDLLEYFVLFLVNPSYALELFFGEKIPVKDIVFENYSERCLYKFNCEK